MRNHIEKALEHVITQQSERINESSQCNPTGNRSQNTDSHQKALLSVSMAALYWMLLDLKKGPGMSAATGLQQNERSFDSRSNHQS